MMLRLGLSSTRQLQPLLCLSWDVTPGISPDLLQPGTRKASRTLQTPRLSFRWVVFITLESIPSPAFTYLR